MNPFNLVFAILAKIIQGIGEGMWQHPEVALLIVLILLADVLGRRLGHNRGMRHGVNMHRAGGAMHVNAIAHLTGWRRAHRGFWNHLFQFSLGFLTVAYILSVWAFDFSSLPTVISSVSWTGFHNPFQWANALVSAVGQGFERMPWMVFIVVLIWAAYRNGFRLGYERGHDHGITLQTGGAAPAAGSHGAIWRRASVRRGLRLGLMTWTFRLVGVMYIIWLWSSLPGAQ